MFEMLLILKVNGFYTTTQQYEGFWICERNRLRLYFDFKCIFETGF